MVTNTKCLLARSSEQNEQMPAELLLVSNHEDTKAGSTGGGDGEESRSGGEGFLMRSKDPHRCACSPWHFCFERQDRLHLVSFGFSPVCLFSPFVELDFISSIKTCGRIPCWEQPGERDGTVVSLYQRGSQWITKTETQSRCGWQPVKDNEKHLWKPDVNKRQTNHTNMGLKNCSFIMKWRMRTTEWVFEDWTSAAAEPAQRLQHTHLLQCNKLVNININDCYNTLLGLFLLAVVCRFETYEIDCWNLVWFGFSFANSFTKTPNLQLMKPPVI